MPGRGPGGVGDVAQRRGLVALAGDDVDRRPEDLLAALGLDGDARHQAETAASARLGPARHPRRAALDELVGEHDALDLRRPLPDAVDAQVAVQPLDGVLAHVAAAAEDLHGPVDDAAGHLRGVELHGGGAGVQGARVERRGRSPRPSCR